MRFKMGHWWRQEHGNYTYACRALLIIIFNSVFIVAPTMKVGTKQNTGDDYYKFRVATIHQGTKVTWLVGTWLYTPTDVAMIPGLSDR